MVITGVGIGRSMASGEVLCMAPALREPQDVARPTEISVEDAKISVQNALNAVNKDLQQRAQAALKAADEGTKKAAPIMQALAQMASDPALISAIEAGISAGKTAERATWEGFAQFEDMLRNLGGYMAERAGDLHDVGQRVIAYLLGVEAPGVPESDSPFVLVARDLSPADTASLDLSKVQAIVTIDGGPTSHTAILARARGIVAVVGAHDACQLNNHQMVVVDAARGRVISDPSEEEIEHVKESRERLSRARELRGLPGSTKDGHLIPLLANVGKPSDAQVAHEYGAEGVGLFRTEFLFIGNEQPPSVEEQTEAYTKLLSQFDGKKSCYSSA